MMANPTLKILPPAGESNAPIKSDYGKSHHTGGVEYWKNPPHLHPNNVSYRRLELFLGHIKAILEDIGKNPELAQEPLVKELAQALSAPFAKAANPLAAKPKWSDEMKKTKAQGRRNPAQFILDEYGEGPKDIRSVFITRAELGQTDYPLINAYGVWLKRHPEDALWPSTEKNAKANLNEMRPEDALAHIRRKRAETQARARANKNM